MQEGKQTELRMDDEQSVARAITQMMPTIRSIASRAVRPGLEFDDAVQEGIIGLFNACKSYDSTKDASFSTYATTCIHNAVADAARMAARKKHTPLNTFVELTEAQEAPACDTPEARLLASERYESTMESIAERLSRMERQVLSLYLDGNAYSTIAARLQTTEKAVDNAMQRARAKLKQ